VLGLNPPEGEGLPAFGLDPGECPPAVLTPDGMDEDEEGE